MIGLISLPATAWASRSGVISVTSGWTEWLAKRVIAWGIAVLGLIVFLVLAGVAVMLGAMQDEFHWALVVTPAVALAVCVIAWSIARQKLPARAFTELKAQLDADAQALRTIGART